MSPRPAEGGTTPERTKGRPEGRPFAVRASGPRRIANQYMNTIESTNSTSQSTTLVMMAFLWLS